MTKKEYYQKILEIKEVSENDKLKNFVCHEIELPKNERSQVTKKQLESASIKANIIQALKDFEKSLKIMEIIPEYAEEFNIDLTSKSVDKVLAQMKKVRKSIKIAAEQYP